jgi:integrase
LQALMRKLPTVEPFHNKQAPYHTISMAEMEDVGLRLLAEAHRPLVPHAKYGAKRPGLHLVANCQTALIIRLMWRIPLRSRSIREMELGKNLFQDAQGVWRLRYVGDELKVSERGGRINTFEVPWPEELVPHLEEYLRDFRPRLPNADTSPLVFLTNRGRPLTVVTLYWRLTDTVSCYLGKRLYPHLLRTLWVDQYLLSSGGDVSTAAYMLNDTVATMLQRYHELRGESHVQKAYNFNQRILGKDGNKTSR